MDDITSPSPDITEDNIFIILKDNFCFFTGIHEQFIGNGNVSRGEHQGKLVNVTASGDEAYIASKLLPEFKEVGVPISTCVFQDDLVEIKLGISDWVTIDTNAGYIRQNISSVCKAVDLQENEGVELFRELEESLEQFALVGQIDSIIRRPLFYPGCPNEDCWQKKCNENRNGSYYCPSCKRNTFEAQLSVVVKVEIEHQGSKIEVAIFNNDVERLFRMDLADMREMTEKNDVTAEETMKRRLQNRELVFLLRPHVWERRVGNDEPQWQLANLIDQ